MSRHSKSDDVRRDYTVRTACGMVIGHLQMTDAELERNAAECLATDLKNARRRVARLTRQVAEIAARDPADNKNLAISESNLRIATEWLASVEARIPKDISRAFRE